MLLDLLLLLAMLLPLIMLLSLDWQLLLQDLLGHQI